MRLAIYGISASGATRRPNLRYVQVHRAYRGVGQSTPREGSTVRTPDASGRRAGLRLLVPGPQGYPQVTRRVSKVARCGGH